MLKGIPKILSPELVKCMMEMGHGDEIILADSNFPAHSIGKRVIRADACGICELLEAILRFFSLDTYAKPVHLMAKVEGDKVETPIWSEYEKIIDKHTDEKPCFLERFEFYERAKEAYVVVITGETARYANVALKKGCVID